MPLITSVLSALQCGICKGQLGDAVSGTDVRIRNGLLNCNDCYMRSRSKYRGAGTRYPEMSECDHMPFPGPNLEIQLFLLND